MKKNNLKRFLASLLAVLMLSQVTGVAPGVFALDETGTTEPTDIKVQWADSGVSWYVTTGKATHQLNSSNTTYYYTVLGYDKVKEDAE